MALAAFGWLADDADAIALQDVKEAILCSVKTEYNVY